MPKTKTPSKRKPNAAFMRPVQPDEKLSAIVGSKPLPRSEMTKKLWDYIKKNGLQDKKKRTQINANDAMRPVFNGKSQVSMFEMTKLVSGHQVGSRRGSAAPYRHALSESEAPPQRASESLTPRHRTGCLLAAGGCLNIRGRLCVPKAPLTFLHKRP